MRSPVALLTLLLATGCSAADSVVATGPRTASVGTCYQFIPTTPITAPANSSLRIATFTAKALSCGTTSSWGISAGRSGSVSAITSVSPSGFSLSGTGTATRNIRVFFSTGAPGTGRVIAHAIMDSPAGDLTDTVIVNVQ